MPEKLEIRLPWPSRAMSSNARGHWSKKAKAASMYRYTCKMISLETIQAGKWDIQALRDMVAAGTELHVFLDFYPPDRRRRDDNNLPGLFKSGLDGVADALGIDDYLFRTHPFFHRDEVINGGEVRVTITTKKPTAGDTA
jgi:crossover junction endodeoxyribonuclease RusA